MTTHASSQEIRDRGSTFVGYVYDCKDAEEAKDAMRRHSRVAQSGTSPYVMGAWRYMVVKPGRTGLSGPDDFVVQEGCEDGGERGAGVRVLGVMRREGVLDAVVVVCRWFGGTLLGGVRWRHVETCAGEVCRRWRKMEEMGECMETLRRLDEVLAGLRTELGEVKRRKADYGAMQAGLDLDKAKRLIHARECAINNTQTLIAQRKERT